VDSGLLARVPYRDVGERERMGYRLTAMGRELVVAVVALMKWGDRWLAPGGPPLELSHSGCGSPVAVELRCQNGHQVHLGEITARARRGTTSPRTR
jgi:hypothetical protein